MDHYDEFARLNYIYNNNKTSGDNADAGLLAGPLWFVRSGRVTGGDLVNYDSGYYWSNTIRNTDNVFALRFQANVISPNDFFSRGYGLSLRCVAR